MPHRHPAGALNRPPNIEKAGIFLKSNSSVVGPSEGIPIRFLDRINEHEIELVAIIGKQGSDIPKDKAKDYIAGYTLGLDMTCRGGEDRSFRKSIDGYSVLGPWFVTADEIANPDDVTITLHLNNGELKQTPRPGPDLRYRPADRVRVVVLHALSGRRVLHRHAAGAWAQSSPATCCAASARGRRVRDQGAGA